MQKERKQIKTLIVTALLAFLCTGIIIWTETILGSSWLRIIGFTTIAALLLICTILLMYYEKYTYIA